MQNPCEECIIKVNCTEICLNKNNYGILLKNALSQFRKAKESTPSKRYTDEYNKYLELWLDHKNDETKVHMRNVGLPGSY
jgi:hypothetical protein